MATATRVTVSTFGVIVGIAGLEHGIGEILQGNVRPDGVMILSWPDSELFAILSGEPAMTVVPNMLATGILAVVASLAFLVWTTLFVERPHGGLVLALLSVAMLLVGGGLSPPLLGLILSATASRMSAPPAWVAHLSPGARRALAAVWPACVVGGVIAFVLLMPGTMLLDYYASVDSAALVVGLAFTALGLMLLAIVTGFARDAQRPVGLPRGGVRGGAPSHGPARRSHGKKAR
jgi:hypothetical protein